VLDSQCHNGHGQVIKLEIGLGAKGEGGIDAAWAIQLMETTKWILSLSL
jgi:hypothetical protein